MKPKQGRNLRNVIGHVYGRLTVMEDVQEVRPRRVVAVCDCGTIKEYSLANLRSGMTKSCGCLKKEIVGKTGEKNVDDLTGQVFGKLTVVKRGENSPHRKEARWLCLCDCGAEKVVTANNLKNSLTRSCGCNQGGGPNEKWTTSEDREIILLSNEGKKLHEISESVNRSPASLAKRFANLRKKVNRKGDYPN